jgi:DNA-binding transcriptional regulator LsrR (DeoR family)
VDALLRRGAVGDIAFRHFDAGGRYLETDLDERVVGLDARALAAIPRRIGVAGGPEKTAAIGAALKGRLVDVLVTDEDTAVSLMAGNP